MTNKKKQLESLLFSAAGVAIMFVILAGAYVIAGATGLRMDLTKEKLYTLSPGTRAILASLDSPVEIRFYSSQGKDMPIELKTYAQRVEDLLHEYRRAANGNLIIRKLDPQPDSDAEDSARLDGLEGQPISMSERIYLGLAVSFLDAKATLPFLDPRRDKLMEYDLSRAISQVTTTEKAVIGIMSGLPVFGEFNPMMMMRGQAQREPWVFVNELQRDFDVREIQLDAERIEADINVLMVVHPKGISDTTQYAIDQFILRGGKVIAFLDPFSIVEAQNSPQANPLQAATAPGSNLEILLRAWGLEFDSNRVIADATYAGRIRGQSGAPEQAPAVLGLTAEAINTDDVVTAQVDNLLLLFPGVFTGTPAQGLTKTVLLKTSPQSQQVEKIMAQFSGAQVLNDLIPSGTEYPLALRLTGKFRTAFPEGPPAAMASHDDDDEETLDPAPGPRLTESVQEGAVVLVGDSDFIFDAYAAQVQDFGFYRLLIPRGGNLSFVQNLAEQMAGDSNLIAVRSRATMNRPFTLVRQKQAEAEQRFRDKISELERSLQETNTRLNELQQHREPGQGHIVLSSEQQAEIQRFRERQAEVNRELRQERRNLRREIDSLENRLKWMNIAAMPALVTLAGVGLALFQRKRTSAK
jgi:ABC-type uncharacterized transport system involved in gliding motility auxiliary subunit